MSEQPITAAAPTAQQLKVLRLMAAGVQLRAPEYDGANHVLVINGVKIGVLRSKTFEAFTQNGWIEGASTGWYVLTKEGRKRAEAGAFVRAFAEHAGEGAK